MFAKEKYGASPEEDMDAIMESIMASNTPSSPITQPTSRHDFTSKNNISSSVSISSRQHNPQTTSNIGISSRRGPININDLSGARPVRKVEKPLTRARAYSNITPPQQQPSRTPKPVTRISDRYSIDISSELSQVEDTEPRLEKKKSGKKFLSTAAILISLILIPLISFTVLKEPIMALLKPKSPFSTELSSKMNIPLYYPTKLPGTYKMEVNSITQPNEGVVLYAITDDADNKINMSVQRQAEDIDIESIYKDNSSVKNIETKYGNVKFGATEADLDIANVMTGQSWVIVTAPTGTIQEKELQQIINSLEY